MEVNKMGEGEVVMGDLDYSKEENNIKKPKKRIAAETGPKLTSVKEQRAQISTVRNR
jgi:hypothetical protein